MSGFTMFSQNVQGLTLASESVGRHVAHGLSYSAGDQVGIESVQQLGNDVEELDIMAAALVDRSQQIGVADLFVFLNATIPAEDNAAATWYDHHMLSLLAVIHLVNVVDVPRYRIVAAADDDGMSLLDPDEARQHFCTISVPPLSTLAVNVVTRVAVPPFTAAGDLLWRLALRPHVEPAE